MPRFLSFGLVLALSACAHDPLSHESPAKPVFAERFAKTDLIGNGGRIVGSADFQQGPNGMIVRLNVPRGGLPPGWHGLHFHAVRDCSDTEAFQKSGGHHGKIEGAHGLLNPAGPEAGDLPNLWVSADGSAQFEAFTSLTDLNTAMDGDGLSIIIHAGRDDHKSQPIGGAGARIACGEVR